MNNINKALRQQQAAASLRKLEERAKKRGWKVMKSVLLPENDYTLFLRKLLRKPQAIDTKGVTIIASDAFAVQLGMIYVHHRASVRKIEKFLKG